MASRRAPATTASATRPTEAMAAGEAAALPDWMRQAVEQGVRPEQALGLIGLGLMRRMTRDGEDLPWMWSEEEEGGSADLVALRQRLELTQLALHTGAPLSTAEVTQLMGARPGGGVVQRGGLMARRLSRNVWKLSRSGEEGERGSPSFSEGFRRRL
jgi:hypothetical protein